MAEQHNTVVLYFGYAENQALGIVPFQSYVPFDDVEAAIRSLAAFLLVGWSGWNSNFAPATTACRCCGQSVDGTPNFSNFGVELRCLPELSINATASWLPYDPIAEHNHWNVIDCALLICAENVIVIEAAEKVLDGFASPEDLLLWADVPPAHVQKYRAYHDVVPSVRRVTFLENYVHVVDRKAK